MTSRDRPQPADEWDFVPQDDEVETDEPVTPSPEIAAMHVDRAGIATPARDAGRADVTLGDVTEAPEYNFTDEEPEHASAEAVEPEEETEPDLEEILESQHYASEPED